MRIWLLKKENASVSLWGGGSTTELFLFPFSASYSGRNFSVRVSSATIEAVPSAFTFLPKFHRVLMGIDGGLDLSFNIGSTLLSDDGSTSLFSDDSSLSSSNDSALSDDSVLSSSNDSDLSGDSVLSSSDGSALSSSGSSSPSANEKKSVFIAPLKSVAFEGGWETISNSLCRDFGVMYSDGWTVNVSTMNSLILDYEINNDFTCIYSLSNSLIISMNSQKTRLECGDFLVFDRVSRIESTVSSECDSNAAIMTSKGFQQLDICENINSFSLEANDKESAIITRITRK